MTPALERERAAILRRITDLRRSFADIAASVDGANTDDEHDPEGATLAFERAQVVSLLDDAERRLEELERAAARVETGTAGECERCGGGIGEARLAAVPTTRVCIDCARRVVAR